MTHPRSQKTIQINNHVLRSQKESMKKTKKFKKFSYHVRNKLVVKQFILLLLTVWSTPSKEHQIYNHCAK